MVQLLWKTVSQLLKKLNTDLLDDPAVPLLGIYPRELNKYVHRKTCTQIFIVALFITAKKVEATQMSYPLRKG